MSNGDGISSPPPPADFGAEAPQVPLTERRAVTAASLPPPAAPARPRPPRKPKKPRKGPKKGRTAKKRSSKKRAGKAKGRSAARKKSKGGRKKR